MIICNKCKGKVFVDLTFTDNKAYETYCLRCGKRMFIEPSHEMYDVIAAYVKRALVA